MQNVHIENTWHGEAIYSELVIFFIIVLIIEKCFA